jgi:hypothetical protein
MAFVRLVCFVLGVIFLIGSVELTRSPVRPTRVLGQPFARFSLVLPPTLPVTQPRSDRSSISLLRHVEHRPVSLAHPQWRRSALAAAAAEQRAAVKQCMRRLSLSDGGAVRAAVIPQRQRLPGGHPASSLQHPLKVF